MVVGPHRDRAELDSAVWDQALRMCLGVFTREWTGPAFTERWLAPPACARLSEVEVPTLVVNGLADLPGVQEIAGLLAQGIAGACRLDLPETGHLPPLERPAQVTAMLTEFLAAV
jgi:pimeloyl-ACP methyl ester carboxylesterase